MIFYLKIRRHCSLFLSAAVFFFLLPSTPLAAQQTDTVRLLPTSVAVALADSLFLSDRAHDPVHRFFTNRYPDPRKAALLAAVFPGAGQAYNKKWWKLPIVYGALGGMTWWTLDNVKTYHEYRDNYKALVDGDPKTVPTDPKYALVEPATLLEYRDRFRKYSEQSYLTLGLLYLLSVTDAFVDAHLHNFDVSDDLSLRLVPQTQSAPGFGASWGLGIQVRFWGKPRI